MKLTENQEIRFDRCALCAESSHLQASHIIPSFVFQWLRDSSATGHFRSSEAPNRRVQDGWKPQMLCRKCEQRFAVWEKEFAEKCFEPINNNEAKRIRYQPWMLKFATSVSWRVLCVFKAMDGLYGFPAHQISAADATLDEWGQFLLDKRPHPGVHEQHMFLSDTIKKSPDSNIPANINRYLFRSIEIYVAHSEHAVITYAKMGRFVLFGFVEMAHPRRWRGTKLNANEGVFGVGDVEIPTKVWDFMKDRARRAANVNAEISDRQRAIIGETYLRDPDRAASSESFHAMHHDVLLFGEKAFEVTQPNNKSSSK